MVLRCVALTRTAVAQEFLFSPHSAESCAGLLSLYSILPRWTHHVLVQRIVECAYSPALTDRDFGMGTFQPPIALVLPDSPRSRQPLFPPSARRARWTRIPQYPSGIAWRAYPVPFRGAPAFRRVPLKRKRVCRSGYSALARFRTNRILKMRVPFFC